MTANCEHIYNCPRVTVPPTVDGKLDDEAWEIAPVTTLILSANGKAATKRTTARMCWDDHNLYVAFECEDTDIYGNLLNRDDPIYTEDVVEVFLCPDGDLTHYFEFELSPRNVQFDGRITNQDGRIELELGWDCEGWRTAVIVDGTLDDRTDIDRGWTAELAIPFSSLGRNTPTPGEEWRGNLYRIDLSPEPVEFQAWSPTLIDPANFHVPGRFGRIVFGG